MKIFGLSMGVLSMAAAERAQGKRGNEVQAEVDRYFWQHPRCKAVETLCDPTCMGDFTEDTGSITVGPEDYKSMKNCLWVWYLTLLIVSWDTTRWVFTHLAWSKLRRELSISIKPDVRLDRKENTPAQSWLGINIIKQNVFRTSKSTRQKRFNYNSTSLTDSAWSTIETAPTTKFTFLTIWTTPDWPGCVVQKKAAPHSTDRKSSSQSTAWWKCGTFHTTPTPTKWWSLSTRIATVTDSPDSSSRGRRTRFTQPTLQTWNNRSTGSGRSWPRLQTVASSRDMAEQSSKIELTDM